MKKERELILYNAKQLLIELGADAVTVSNVAERARLDYTVVYALFNDSSSLLIALAASFLEEYRAYLTTYQLGSTRRIEQTLEPWLLHLLEHRESDSCTAFFKEFGALSLHNRELRLVMDRYYRQLYQILFDKLQSIAPDGCANYKIESATCLLLPFIEGYGLTRNTLPTSVLSLSTQLSTLLRAILLE